MSQAEADNTDFRGTDEGAKMKFTSGWMDGGNGTNSSGFSALPAGMSSNGGITFSGVEMWGEWWTSTTNGRKAYYRSLHDYNDLVWRPSGWKSYYRSARCIKDN